jgi:hypothetical protein
VKKLLLGVAALVAAFMWSRGARDPREWPSRFPKEIQSVWDDLDDAFAAARRAAARERDQFDEDLRRARSDTPT